MDVCQQSFRVFSNTGLQYGFVQKVHENVNIVLECVKIIPANSGITTVLSSRTLGRHLCMQRTIFWITTCLMSYLVSVAWAMLLFRITDTPVSTWILLRKQERKGGGGLVTWPEGYVDPGIGQFSSKHTENNVEVGHNRWLCTC